MAIVKHPTLWKKDSSGNPRGWYMETDGHAYRSVSITHIGTETPSGWKYGTPKNEGRVNASTAESQALAEVASQYKVKQEIGGFHEDIAQSGKAHFQPMLAMKYEDAIKKKKIDPNGRLYNQPKLDGLRCVQDATGSFSRNGKPHKGVPHIAEFLADFYKEFPDVILDGELYNHELKDDFNKVVSLAKREAKNEKEALDARNLIQYHIYDAPVIADGAEAVFGRRYEWLEQMFGEGGPYEHPSIKLVETIATFSQDQIDEDYGRYLSEGYEGQMLRMDVPYVSDRDWALIKRKEFQDEEFTIERVEEGVGNWAGCAKRVVYRMTDGRTFETGLRGKMDWARKVLEEADEYVGGIGTVRFQNKTPEGPDGKGGVPRFGVTTQLFKKGEERP